MTTKIKKWKKCGTCLGDGKCSHCKGRGQAGFEVPEKAGGKLTLEEDCKYCQATGDCAICKGEGGKWR